MPAWTSPKPTAKSALEGNNKILPNTLTVDKVKYAVGSIAPLETSAKLDFDVIFEQMAKRFSKVPTIEHKCHNCGGTLEIKADEGIFKCPYCKSVYAIGTSRTNWRY